MQELGGPTPLPATRIPRFFKENIPNITLSSEPRSSILGEMTIATIKYQNNKLYRQRKSQVSYQDHIQSPNSIQPGKPSKRPGAQDVRELLKSDAFRKWLARNATEQQWQVLEDLLQGETYSSIAQTYSVSTKTVQRMVRDFWQIVLYGCIKEHIQYTSEFLEFVYNNGSRRQNRIIIAYYNQKHTYIAKSEQVSTKTVQRDIKTMIEMAEAAEVPIYESVIVQVKPFLRPRPADRRTEDW